MSANCDATAIAEEEQHVLGVKLQQLSGGEDTTENDSSTNDSLFNDFYGEFGEEVKDHNPNSNIQKHAAAAQAGTAAAELGAITAMEAIDDERNVDFVNHSTSIKSSSGSIINSTGDISIHGSANAPSQSSSGPIKWTNLKNAEQGESVEVFLQNADIGSVIFSIDAAVVKDAIFSAIAKFDKFPELQMRAIQLLQDCHMLTPGGIGITNLELNQRLEVLLRVLSSWLSRADIAVSMFELLAMLADRAAMIDHCCRVSDCELLQCMARALEMHSSCKEVQRAGLMLYESILRNATARSRKIFAEKMFRSVLDNLLLHSDDPFICYASFSILDSLAEAVSSTSSSSNALLAPFSDQLVGLTLSSIASLHSSSVVCKCIEFLEKLTSLSTQATTAAAVVNTASATSGPASTAGASGDASIDALAAVAGHSRGLWIFVDAVGILQAEEIAACISCLELMQKILTTAPLLLLALENIDNQGESRIEHLVEVEAEFRQKCDRYFKLLAECDKRLDRVAVEYWLRLSELIIAVLVELPTLKVHNDAADKVAQRNLAIRGGSRLFKSAATGSYDAAVCLEAAVVEAVPVNGKLSNSIAQATVAIPPSAFTATAARGRHSEDLVRLLPLYAVVEKAEDETTAIVSSHEKSNTGGCSSTSSDSSSGNGCMYDSKGNQQQIESACASSSQHYSSCSESHVKASSSTISMGQKSYS